MHGRFPQHQRIVAAVLLIAFLPTLTFLGHWNEILGGSSPTTGLAIPSSGGAIFDLAAQQADQAAHAQHCHTNLSSCTEQPMPAGLGLLLTHEQWLQPPELFAAPWLPEARPQYGQSSISPPTPPPRSN